MLRRRQHRVVLEARCSNCGVTKVETFDYTDPGEVERAAAWPPKWLSFAAPFWVDNFWEKLEQTDARLTAHGRAPLMQIAPRVEDPLYEQGGAYLCTECVSAASRGLAVRREEVGA